MVRGVDASEIVTLTRVFGRAGLLKPGAPQHLVGAVKAMRHYGFNYAGGFSSAGARKPNRPCVVDERGMLTWGELDRRASALASSLAERGVGEGDLVATLMRNHRGFIEVMSALAKLGANVLYLNTGFSGPQLREVLEREAPVAVVFDEEFTGLIEEDSSVELKIVAWHDTKVTGPTLDRLIFEGDTARMPAPSRPGKTIILTSGTTGTPKGAPRNQASSMGPVVAMLDRIPYHEGDVMVMPAPLFHSWGFGNMSLGMLLAATYVLRRKFNPEQVLADIEQYKATVLVAVPVMLQRILELPDDVRRRYDTSSLRIVPLSGSAIPTEMATRWMDEFGDNIYNLYGSTEVGWVSIATPADLRVDPATGGKPPRGTRIRLLDDEGKEVPQGEIGRIFVSNDALTFEGYTGGGHKEIVDGFMSTGDTGRLDPEGRLRVEGRDDEMIVSGGENVFPLEVEDMMMTHPDILEAAAIGVADDDYGKRLKAFVVLREGAALTGEEVRAHVRENLAGYKVPREVVFLDELPRNATGKVLKRTLS